MKTRTDRNPSLDGLRQENARRAALASGVLRPVQATAEEREVDEKLAHWEAMRAQFAGRLRLPWGTESAAVMKAVSEHRAYWRPAEVRLLVLSESHVWTREAELAAEVPLEVFGHHQAPLPFVRMVYCLGYGERNLLQGPVHGKLRFATVLETAGGVRQSAAGAAGGGAYRAGLSQAARGKARSAGVAQGAGRVADGCLSGGAVRRFPAEAEDGCARAGARDRVGRVHARGDPCGRAAGGDGGGQDGV